MTDESNTQEQPTGTATANVPVPPYIAYSTFKTFLEELKTNGIPPQIDSSVLKRFSYGVQGQLKSAIRSMGLVAGDKPTWKLQGIVDAYGGDGFGAALGGLMRTVYPYVFKLDLMTATPTMFADAFKETGAKEDVARKCRTFFLNAAKDAGIELGTRLATAGATRSAGGSGGAVRRKTRNAKGGRPKEDGGADPGNQQEDQNRQQHVPGVLDRLLDKFPAFDPKWPDEIKAKWFENFDAFMSRATKT
jgi:hypothetical protein